MDYTLTEDNNPLSNTYWTPDRIRSIRKSTGLSQQAFGSAIGLSWQTIANYENGRSNPRTMARHAYLRIQKHGIKPFVGKNAIDVISAYLP